MDVPAYTSILDISLLPHAVLLSLSLSAETQGTWAYGSYVCIAYGPMILSDRSLIGCLLKGEGPPLLFGPDDMDAVYLC